MWCIPPEQDADFVCAMEKVLAVYPRPEDSQRPVICFDEKSKQLVGETVAPVAAGPGQPERHDYEYVRNGTANLFMMVNPLGGWRRVNVTARRTKVDFALQMKELVDRHYPRAVRITLVMDNLNTPKMSSLYEAFEPEEARRIKAVDFVFAGSYTQGRTASEAIHMSLNSWFSIPIAQNRQLRALSSPRKDRELRPNL